jgi:hypothetical protein
MTFIDIENNSTLPVNKSHVVFYDNHGHIHTGVYQHKDKTFNIYVKNKMSASEIECWQYIDDSLSRRNGVESDSLDNRLAIQLDKALEQIENLMLVCHKRQELYYNTMDKHNAEITRRHSAEREAEMLSDRLIEQKKTIDYYKDLCNRKDAQIKYKDKLINELRTKLAKLRAKL